MREINKIIIHCSATRTDQSFNVEDIRGWHVNGNGWSDIGYHFYIKLDGTIQEGRPLGRVGSHTKGHNTGSIGLCFEGGYNPDGTSWLEPTDNQKCSFIEWLCSIESEFGKLPVHGHREFSSKDCPGFDVMNIMYWN